MAEILFVFGLVIAAFMLGACPFSLWIGKLSLRKDIRNYGDGNPGATNVFKAGGRWWGVVAIIADIAKGIPVVVIAKSAVILSQPLLYLVAMAAVLGHAYSPLLHFRGGKALAVFAGTLLALSEWDIIVCLVVFFLLGFLLIGNDAWIVMLGMIGTLITLLMTRVDLWEVVFISGIAAIFLVKQYDGLQASALKPGRLICWIKSNRKTA